MISFSSSAFAEEGGNSGGGGGNAEHIALQTKGQSSSVLAKGNSLLAADQARWKAEEKKKSEQEELEMYRGEFLRLTQEAVMIYTTLKAFNYPFEQQVVSENLLKSTIKTIARTGAITLGKNLKLQSSDGKWKEVTFISDPDRKTVVINVPKLLEQIARKELKPAMLATAFHELLVLNRIEASMTYNISNEFAVARKAMGETAFWYWAKTQPLLIDCAKSQDRTKIKELSKNHHYSSGGSGESFNEFGWVMRMILNGIHKRSYECGDRVR